MCDIHCIHCTSYISAHPQRELLIDKPYKSLIQACYIRVFYVSPKLFSLAGQMDVSIISTPQSLEPHYDGEKIPEMWRMLLWVIIFSPECHNKPIDIY